MLFNEKVTCKVTCKVICKTISRCPVKQTENSASIKEIGIFGRYLSAKFPMFPAKPSHKVGNKSILVGNKVGNKCGFLSKF